MDLWHSFKLYSLWVLIQILLCSCLPGSVAVDIEPCKPKIVLLDIKDNRKNYIIPYEVCEDQDSVCHLSNGNGQCFDPIGIPGVGRIKEVYLNTENNGTIIKLPHDSETFNVSLQGDSFLSMGVYNWKISYQYEKDCINRVMSSPETCTGRVHLNLMIVVIDLEFHLSTGTDFKFNGHKAELHIKDGGDTKNIFKCSADFGNQLIPQISPRFKFVFSASQDLQSNTTEDYTKTMWCNETETVVQDGNWIVSHEENSCFLILTDFGAVDNGYYHCIVYFPNSNSPYNDDPSLSVSLFSQSELKPSQPIINLIFVITIVVGSLFAASILIPISAYYLYKCRPRPRPPNPEPRPQDAYGTLEPRPQDNYGTFSSASPNPVLCASQFPNDKKLIEAETNFSDINDSEQSSPEQPSKRHHRSHHTLSDDELMNLQIAGEENTPPCNCKHDSKPKLICRCCKKSYCDKCQGLFYTRHIRQCGSTSFGSQASQNRLHSAEPESGSNSSTPDSFGTSSEQSQSS